MEKQFSCTGFRFCKRLLISKRCGQNSFKNKFNKNIIFILLGFFIFAPVYALPEKSQTADFVFSVSPESRLITDTDILLTLEIKGVVPEKVSLSFTDLSNALPMVKVRSMTKSALPGTVAGTVVKLTLRFMNDGIFSLPSINLTVNKKNKTASFPLMDIKKNPYELEPQLILKFNDGTVLLSDSNLSVNLNANSVPAITVNSQNNRADFTLYLKYAASFSDLHWEIPKNSLFSCIKQYEPENFVQNSDSLLNFDYEKEIPVADFEWTVPGKKEAFLEKLELNIQTYSEEQRLISFMPFSIRIEQKSSLPAKKSGIKTEEHFFNASEFEDFSKFSIEQNYNKNQDVTDITDEECMEIVRQLGKTKKIYKLCLLVAVLSFIVFVILAVSGKHRLFFTIGSVLFLGISVFLCMNVSKKTGVFMGGVIHSIPVENSSMNAELDKGIVVQIEEKAGEWLFVSHNKIAGWCTQDSVISVK